MLVLVLRERGTGLLCMQACLKHLWGCLHVLAPSGGVNARCSAVWVDLVLPSFFGILELVAFMPDGAASAALKLL